MGIRDTSILWKINIFLQIIALILSLSGFGSNYLITYDKYQLNLNLGLWKICVKDTCNDVGDALKGKELSDTWLKASKAMMSIALITEFIAIVMTAMAFFQMPVKLQVWATAVVAFMSAVFGLIGGGVAVGEGKSAMKDINKHLQDLDIGWSCTVFMIGQGGFMLSSALHFVDFKFFASTSATTRAKPSVPMWVGVACVTRNTVRM